MQWLITVVLFAYDTGPLLPLQLLQVEADFPLVGKSVVDVLGTLNVSVCHLS
jgi:hypothetical protein